MASGSYTIQRLAMEDLTDDVLRCLSDVHVKAFVNEPLTEIMVEYKPRISNIRWRAAIRATALEGELWVLKVKTQGEKEELASCAAWFPPGKFLFGTEKQRALGYYNYISVLSPATLDWLQNEYSPQMLKVLTETKLNSEDKEHLWWVSSLATHPSCQAQGYGTALMNVLIQKVGNMSGSKQFIGLAASPDNIPLYKSLGFQVDGSGEVTTPKGNRLSFHILTKFRSEQIDKV